MITIVACQEATRLACLRMERKLTLKETLDLNVHLLVCTFCRRFSSQMEALNRILARYSPIAEKQMPLGAKQRIRGLLGTL